MLFYVLPQLPVSTGNTSHEGYSQTQHGDTARRHWHFPLVERSIILSIQMQFSTCYCSCYSLVSKYRGYVWSEFYVSSKKTAVLWLVTTPWFFTLPGHRSFMRTHISWLFFATSYLIRLSTCNHNNKHNKQLCLTRHVQSGCTLRKPHFIPCNVYCYTYCIFKYR